MISRKNRLPLSLATLVLAAILAGAVYSWYFQVLPQSALRLLEEIPAPLKNDRILVFTPHPDDETLACGGYLAAAAADGASVWIALVTDGNKHGQEKIRYQEFKNAAATLGVPESHLFFLGFPDGQLKRQDPRELRLRFEEIISQVKPGTVFAPHPLDHHRDHEVVGKIAASAASGKNITCYQYLVHHNLFPHPKKFAPDLFMLPPLRMYKPGGAWKKFTLDPELEDLKLAAVLRYKSQLHDRRDPFLRTLLLSMVRQNELFASP
jgi:LmbE family N-acetylglucosaminyl deacetylase